MTTTGLSDAFFGVYSFDESSFAETTTARRRDGRDDDRARPAVTFAREYVARDSIMEEEKRTENGRSLETFVRWKRSFVSRSRARVSFRSSRARGRSGTISISMCFISLGSRSPPFAPISLLRIYAFECPRITMPLRASSEELTSDRDSKNGGVSMRRPSSVRDSITASMPRCQTSVRLIWTDSYQARTSQ